MKQKDAQSYLKRSDINIEGNVATWNISSIGPIQGSYVGVFKFKCYLTPTEKLAAGREYRSLLGPNATLAFANEDNLAFSLAQLKYRIISAPPFWSSAIGLGDLTGDIPDEKIIDTILEAAVASELKYLALLDKNKREALKRAKDSAERLAKDKEKKGENEEDEEDEGDDQ